jgi:Domain of unknown function (DUF4124)
MMMNAAPLPPRRGKAFLAAAIYIALASSLATAEPLYKWIDAQGRTHYSNEAPPQGVQFETLGAAPQPAIVAPKEQIDWAAKEREFQKRQQVRQQRASIEAAERSLPPEQREVKCRVARTELASAQAASAGASADERRQALAQLSADIAKWCEQP